MVHLVRLAPHDHRLVAAGTMEHDPAVLRLVHAGQAVEQRGLAGPVRADDREDLSPSLVQAYIRQAGDAAETKRDVAHLDDDVPLGTGGGDRAHARGAHTACPTGSLMASAVPTPCSASPISRLRRREGIMPSGLNIIMTTSKAPRYM